jgi:NADH pyrophosphatase NudC (nudix superfamily)
MKGYITNIEKDTLENEDYRRVLYTAKNSQLVLMNIKPETFEDCARRELVEEANVKMLSFKPIGYQKAYLPNGPKEYQLRVFCEVRPIGKFEEDPDGDITEIKYIDPTEYRKYFDWGDVGERIIERAIELKEKL